MEEFVLEGVADTEQLLEELMNEYGQDLLQLVYSYVRNRTAAEDVTQEIFVKCYRNLHTYKGQASMRTWLWRIAINHCKDYLKSWYARKVLITDHDYFAKRVGQDLEEAVLQQESDAELASAVLELPIAAREVIYLFYFEELTTREMSEILGLRENTVKSRLSRAKKQLKQQLGGAL